MKGPSPCPVLYNLKSCGLLHVHECIPQVGSTCRMQEALISLNITPKLLQAIDYCRFVGLFIIAAGGSLKEYPLKIICICLIGFQ